MLIYLVGLPGVGKTYLGKELAHQLDFNFIDLDTQIETVIGLTISEIFDHRGEEYFRDIEREELEKTTHLQNTVIAAGGGTPCFFDNIEKMNASGTTIYLVTSLDRIEENLRKEEQTRPLLKGNIGEKLKNLLASREKFYKSATTEVQVNDDPIKNIISFLNLQKD